jgi:AcrR family transcriptional regulator
MYRNDTFRSRGNRATETAQENTVGKAAVTKKRTSIGAQRNPASQEAILNAAEELLLEHGPGSFSIEAVAKRAKAGKPTIYRWWPSKAALLLDVYHRQKQVPPHPQSGSVEQDIFLFVKGLIDHWKTGSGAVFRSIVAEAQSDETAAEALRDYLAERWGQSSEMFVDGKNRGEVANWVDPAIAMETVSGYAWSRLLTGRLDVADEEIRLHARQFAEGVKAR